MNTNQYFAAAFSLAFVAGAARAQSEAAMLGEVAALPLAITAPVTLPAGTSFVVRAVDASAFAATYTLERTDTGARLQIEVSARGVRRTCVAAGTVVTATATRTGTVLVAGADAIAFVPNALGRALLREEQAKL